MFSCGGKAPSALSLPLKASWPGYSDGAHHHSSRNIIHPSIYSSIPSWGFDLINLITWCWCMCNIRFPPSNIHSSSPQPLTNVLSLFPRTGLCQYLHSKLATDPLKQWLPIHIFPFKTQLQGIDSLDWLEQHPWHKCGNIHKTFTVHLSQAKCHMTFPKL